MYVDLVAFKLNELLFTDSDCKHEKELKGKNVRGETSHRAQVFFKPTIFPSIFVFSAS